MRKLQVCPLSAMELLISMMVDTLINGVEQLTAAEKAFAQAVLHLETRTGWYPYIVPRLARIADAL